VQHLVNIQSPGTSGHRRLLAIIGAFAIVVAVTIAVALSTSSAANAAGGSNTITVAVGSAPLGLDPAENGNNADEQLVNDLAYEPLIMLEPNGSVGPGLAVSWKYTGKSLKTFELTLRSGVKFSDGSPLTAAAVVASLQHQMTAKGPLSAYIQFIKSAQAAGPLKVILHLSSSNPSIAMLLTQRFAIGDITAPAASANPKLMGTATYGAGPYELDPAQTVAGSKYVYVPNPDYYDQSAIHYSTFTVLVIANPQTALSALQSGQIQYADGSFSSASTAQSAGLNIYAARASWYGVILFDHGGALVPALKNPLVRQALNYATDRAGITQAIFGKYGAPNDEISVPGYESQGYDPSYASHYTYSLTKARKLMAEAGYSKGFSLTIGASTPFGDGVEFAEAVASDWAKIGVHVKIDSFATGTAFLGPWLAKKLPAITLNWDVAPMFIEAGQLLVKSAGSFNPFKVIDPGLASLINTADNQTTAAGIQKAWVAVERKVVDLGWEVPICSGSYVFFANKSVKGIALSPVSFAPNPTLWHN
jgi:peptide/nickel transport system substrate-binding protein